MSRAHRPPPDGAKEIRRRDSPARWLPSRDGTRGSRCGCGSWSNSRGRWPRARHEGLRNWLPWTPEPAGPPARWSVNRTRALRSPEAGARRHGIGSKTPAHDRWHNSSSESRARPPRALPFPANEDPRATAAPGNGPRHSGSTQPHERAGRGRSCRSSRLPRGEQFECRSIPGRARLREAPPPCVVRPLPCGRRRTAPAWPCQLRDAECDQSAGSSAVAWCEGAKQLPSRFCRRGTPHRTTPWARARRLWSPRRRDKLYTTETTPCASDDRIRRSLAPEPDSSRAGVRSSLSPVPAAWHAADRGRQVLDVPAPRQQPGYARGEAPLRPVELCCVGPAPLFRVAHRAEREAHAVVQICAAIKAQHPERRFAVAKLERAIVRLPIEGDRGLTGGGVGNAASSAHRCRARAELTRVPGIDGPARLRINRRAQLGAVAVCFVGNERCRDLGGVEPIDFAARVNLDGP